MTTAPEEERQLDRRLLLRGGAVLAGAAGVAAVGAALAPTTAQAADGQFAVMGQENTSDASTEMALNAPGGTLPTLQLTNPAGPALELTPTGLGYSGVLKVGQVASTTNGLELGVTGDVQAETTWLATGLDLEQLPITFPIRPYRLVDTRSTEGRKGIRSSSPDAFDSEHRLRAGSWFDVAIIDATFVGLLGVYVNLTGVRAEKSGFATVYPPGERPETSTLNMQSNQTIANAALVPADIANEDEDWWVIRVYSSTTVHIVVDLTGVSLFGISGTRNTRGSVSQQKAVKGNRMARFFEPDNKR